MYACCKGDQQISLFLHAKRGDALQERRGSMKPGTRIEAPLGLASCPARDGPTFG